MKCYLDMILDLPKLQHFQTAQVMKKDPTQNKGPKQGSAGSRGRLPFTKSMSFIANSCRWSRLCPTRKIYKKHQKTLSSPGCSS